MVIAVNGRHRRQAATGVQRYAAEVVSALTALLGPDQIREIVPPAVVGSGPLGKVWDLAALNLAAPLRSRPAPVVLSPCNWGPVTRGRRSVVVVHDNLVEELPEYYSSGYRAATRLYLDALRATATTVVTVSAASRTSLERRLAKQIAVAPCGVRPPTEEALADGRAKLTQRASLPASYALFIGAHDARKNLPFAQGLAPVLAECGLELVVTTRGSGRTTRASAASPGTLVVDSPDDEELWALYADAALLLHPSIAEGFGLPLLEASAVGTPWISTPVGEAAELAVGDHQVVALDGDWASAVRAVMGGPSLSALLRARAGEYGWARPAEVIAEVCASR